MGRVAQAVVELADRVRRVTQLHRELAKGGDLGRGRLGGAPEQPRESDVEGLEVSELLVRDFRPLIDMPASSKLELDAQVQFRHRMTATNARVSIDGTRATVRFAENVKAAAPGQAVVVYEGDRVIGGGWLESAS